MDSSQTCRARLDTLADALAALPVPTGRPLVVATDGSRVAHPDGHVGGWAWAWHGDGDARQRAGAVRTGPVTSSRMELRAVLQALRATRDRPWVLLLVDSASTVGLVRDLEGCLRRGLRGRTGRRLADTDLLEAIAVELASTPARAVHVSWVRAHGRTRLNQVVDRNARARARRAVRRRLPAAATA